MRKLALAALSLTFLLTACKESFQKGENGMEYKIIKSGSGAAVKDGEFMYMQIAQLINSGGKDSVFTDSRETMGQFQVLDSTQTRPEFYKLLSQLRKGDSLFIRVLSDSVFKEDPMQMPPFIEKGDFLITTVKLVDIFKNEAAADSARTKELELAQVRAEQKMKDQLVKDDKALQDYFKKNNITVSKAPEGTYVQIIEPGTGDLIDSTVVPLVNYTGKTLAGVMFDSNTDPSKGHVEPIIVNMPKDPMIGNTSLIQGWFDGMTLLRKGSKAKFYIPSSLAYGPQAMGPDIKANENLIFDIEIVDVMNKTQATVKAQEQMEKMREMQKRYMDSLQKASPQVNPSGE